MVVLSGMLAKRRYKVVYIELLELLFSNVFTRLLMYIQH
jgi:hypothetical protein